MDNDRGAALLQLVGELAAEVHPAQTPQRSVSLDSTLSREIGLDSLARVELIARIERHFGVSLPEHVFADAETPRDLLAALWRASTPGKSPITPKIAPIDAVAVGSSVPEMAQTLVEVLNWHVNTEPNRPHIRIVQEQGQEEVITYGALWQESQAVATGLQALGLQGGQAVVIMLPTGREYFLSFFGAILAGGIPVPIYPPARLSQLEDHIRRHRAILANCQAAVLVTVTEAKLLAHLLKAQVDTLQDIVTVEELCRGEPCTLPALGPHDVALLQYTSGSTGDPKGVVLTHANLLANIRAMGEAVQAKPGDVFVSWLPLYHDMGLIGAWLGILYYGAVLIVMSPLAFLAHPQRWLWAIHHYRGTLSAAPNFAYELCLRRIEDQHLEGLDLHSWRAAFNGAEPVSPETVQRFSQRFARYGFQPQAMMPVYGLAEATLGLTLPPLGRVPILDRIQREPFMDRGAAIPAGADDPTALCFVACGQALKKHEIRIVDPDGHELPDRREGRLQFRGPSATSGYYRNPEATRRLFYGDWLEPGDRAYIGDGDVYITGRSHDIIIRAGRNIYPHELEEAVGGLTGIRQGRVTVFGSRDPRSQTERLVVIAETQETDPAALEHLRTEINSLAADLTGDPPEDIVLAPPGTVLKTSSGKIRRSASRELYERGALGKTRRPLWWQIIRLAFGGLRPLLQRMRRRAATLLYAGYAWTFTGTVVFVTWIAVALLPRFEWRWGVMRRALRLLTGATRTTCTIEGLNHLPPPDRPCVFVANHASYLDAYFLGAYLPRHPSFVAKAEFTRSFITRVFLTRIGTEFVERFDQDKGMADTQRLIQKVAAGHSLLFFPEGTFTRRPGLLPFHMGAFVVAAKAGVPVVPIAIRGTRSMLRSGSWILRPGMASITIGPPIKIGNEATTTPADTWATALKLRVAAREYILRHCREPDLAHETDFQSLI
jgi:1-acyl-sn-glycerol-3-phosphate acyltransferase